VIFWQLTYTLLLQLQFGYTIPSSTHQQIRNSHTVDLHNPQKGYKMPLRKYDPREQFLWTTLINSNNLSDPQQIVWTTIVIHNIGRPETFQHPCNPIHGVPTLDNWDLFLKWISTADFSVLSSDCMSCHEDQIRQCWTYLASNLEEFTNILQSFRTLHDASNFVCCTLKGKGIGKFYAMKILYSLLELSLFPHIPVNSSNELHNILLGPGSEKCLLRLFPEIPVKGRTKRQLMIEKVYYLWTQQSNACKQLGIHLLEGLQPVELSTRDIEHALCECHKHICS